MAEIHGKEGRIQLAASSGTGEIDVNVNDWKLRRETDYALARTFDTTTGIKTARHYAGFTADSGSFEGYMISGLGLVFQSLDGTTGTATFTSGDGTDYVCVIVLKDVEIHNPIDDVVTFSASFEVEGEITDPA